MNQEYLKKTLGKTVNNNYTNYINLNVEGIKRNFLTSKYCGFKGDI